MQCQRPWMQSTQINKLFAALDNNTRFVGGCVRDALLGIDAEDIDMATPLLPEEVIKRLKANNIKAIPTGLEHGTITAVIEGQPFEITTLRRDTSCDGRHAEVDFTDSWQQDAARRDFTINALSCGLDGKIYDYFSGLDDLQNSEVKFVGNADDRCREDYLRILRYFRFTAYYGKGKFNADAINACKANASGIKSLSGERIRQEMLKLLASENVILILDKMQEIGVSQKIFQGNINLDLAKNLRDLIKSGEALILLASLLKNNISDLKSFTKLWKLSNKEAEFLKQILLTTFEPSPDSDILEHKKLARKVGKRIYRGIMLLLAASDMQNSDKYLHRINEVEKWQIPFFPVNGKDLMNKGINPGKEMGILLAKGESWWEDNNYAPSKRKVLDYIIRK